LGSEEKRRGGRAGRLDRLKINNKKRGEKKRKFVSGRSIRSARGKEREKVFLSLSWEGGKREARLSAVERAIEKEKISQAAARNMEGGEKKAETISCSEKKPTRANSRWRALYRGKELSGSTLLDGREKGKKKGH